MAKVKLMRPAYVGGTIRAAGETVDLTDEQVKALTDAGALDSAPKSGDEETKKVEAAPENKTMRHKAE